jgi:hypothetical protein
MCHDALAGEPLEDPLDLGLDRPPDGLPLPSDEAAAVEVEPREEGATHRGAI